MNKKLTKKQEKRLEKFWDRGVVNGLMTSNVPQHFVEHTLNSILSLDDEAEFLKQSKEMGLLKLVNVEKKKWNEIWNVFKKESGRYEFPVQPDCVLHLLNFLKENYKAPDSN
jgi:hypothetical protein